MSFVTKKSEHECQSEENHRDCPNVEVVSEQSAQTEELHSQLILCVQLFLEERQVESVDETQEVQFFEEQNGVLGVPNEHDPNTLSHEHSLDACEFASPHSDSEGYPGEQDNNNAKVIQKREYRH